MIGSQQGLPRDPASTVESGHKCVVNRRTVDTHSIQIPHPLSEGTDILGAVFTDHCEECTFLAGLGLSMSYC